MAVGLTAFWSQPRAPAMGPLGTLSLVPSGSVVQRSEMNLTKRLFWLMYAFNVLMLVLERKITMLTAIYAAKERPIALAGRGGSYIVDPTFE